MKKIIILITLVFLLFSCGKNDLKVNKNYIGLGFLGEEGIDINLNNNKKIGFYLGKENLAGINLENIEKNNINNLINLLNEKIKTKNISLTIGVGNFNENLLKILDNKILNKIDFMLINNKCEKGKRDIVITKKIGKIFIDRNIENIGITILCRNDVMKSGILIFEDKKQEKIFKEDINLFID